MSECVFSYGLHPYEPAHVGILLQLSIRIPVTDPRLGEDPASTWDMWNVIRTHCAYNQRLDLSMCFSVLYNQQRLDTNDPSQLWI
jgi:PRMT5 TIM barrel domain